MGKAQREEAAVASLNPDDMLQGGLKDDFRGKITEAVYCRWDYDGNIEEPVLAARLTIEAEDEDEPIVQHWSAGNLDAFVPSLDGKEPCDDDEVGPYALRVGKRAQLNNNTNFSHLMSSIIDAGEASKGKHFTRKDLTASLACLEGLDAQFNRVPQKKRSGLTAAEGEDGEKKRGRDVLVVTEVFGYGDDEPKKGSGKSKVSSKSKKAADEDDDEDEAPTKGKKSKGGDIDDDLQELIKEAIDEAGGKLKKSKLAGIVVQAWAGDPKKKSAGVKRVADEDFLQAGPWNFDEDTGILKAEAEDEEEDE